MYRFLSICFAFSAFSHSLLSQESSSAAGGDASGANGSVAFTIGQVFYQNFQDSTALINEGVQQPKLDTSSPANFSLVTNAVSVSFYPNPVERQLYMQFINTHWAGLQYAIIDSRGRSVLKGQVNHPYFSISTQHLAAGLYLLTLSRKDEVLVQHKLLKN